eukprot:RCo054583
MTVALDDNTPTADPNHPHPHPHPHPNPHPHPDHHHDNGKPLWPGSPAANLLASFLCTCFGNANQAVPMLVWLQPFFLLRALLLYFCKEKRRGAGCSVLGSVAFVVFVVVMHTVGTAVALGPGIIHGASLLFDMVFILVLGLIDWTIAMLTCILPFVLCTRRRPCSWIQPVLFPTCWTAVLVVSSRFDNLTSFAGSARDLVNDTSF